MTIHDTQPAISSFASHAVRLREAGTPVLTRALRHGGWFADVFCEQSVQHTGAWCLGKTRRPPLHLQRQVTEGTSVRVLTEAEERIVDIDALQPAAWHEAASRVAQQIEAGPGRSPIPVRHVFEAKPLPPDAPDGISETEKHALLRAAAEAVWALDDRVQQVEVRYHDRTRRTAVLTSDGVFATEATLLLGLRVTVTLGAGGRRITGQAASGGTEGFGYFLQHPPERLAQAAVAQAQRLAAARPLPSGPMPVVLAAGWGGAWLHEAIGHALEADVAANHPRTLGTTVASPQVTLVDDATRHGGRATSGVDDEGTPARRTTLIQNGTLCGWLTDRRRARQHGLPCSGNGRRQSYRHVPLPRMTNLLLEPGNAAPDDLIADVADGLFVQTLGQGRVLPDGTFALTVREGYRIEKGRRTHPVSGVVLRGKSWESLRRIVGVGDDFVLDTAHGLCEKHGQVVPVSVGMPTVLIASQEVVDANG